MPADAFIMADARFLATGFKPETVEYLMENMKEIWPDFSVEKVEDLLNFLKKKEVTCEADMETIDEGELGTVVGRGTARNLLRHIRMINARHQAQEHREKNKSTSSTTGQPDATPKAGVGPHYQRHRPDQATHLEQSLQHSKKEMSLEASDTTGNTIMRLAGCVETAMNTMARQMDAQSKIMDTFSSTVKTQSDIIIRMSNDVVDIQRNQTEFLAKTMNRMENSDKRNHESIMELTRKVNDSLLEREMNRPALSANCVMM